MTQYVFVWVSYGESEVYDVSNVDTLYDLMTKENGLPLLKDWGFDFKFSKEQLTQHAEKYGFEKTLRAVEIDLNKQVTVGGDCDMLDYGSGFKKVEKI